MKTQGDQCEASVSYSLALIFVDAAFLDVLIPFPKPLRDVDAAVAAAVAKVAPLVPSKASEKAKETAESIA